MNKTISITLDGQLFHVEEPAYASLDRYLQAVRAHFSSYPDRDEIVSDIESRMAEQFNAKVAGKNHVINQADIEEIIKIMGTVEDFKAFDDQGADSASQAEEPVMGPKRKLYRDSDDKILGGVASGLAAYFGIDATIVRLVFILTLFAGGTGVVAYLILWLIVPEALTPSEKMAMRGERITIADLERKFRDTVKRADDQVKKNETMTRAGKAVSDVAGGLLSVLGKIFMLLIKIIGFFISVGTAIALFALTFAFVSILVNLDSPYVYFPWQGLMDRPIFYILAASAYLSVFVPLQFIFLAGSSLLSGKSKFRTSVVAGLTALWFAALLIGGTTASRYVPQYVETWHEQQATERAENTRVFELADFQAIDLNDGLQATVIQGEVFDVQATGTDRGMERLQISVVDGVLQGRLNDRDWRMCAFCPGDSVEIMITMPMVSALTVKANGGSRIELTGSVDVLTLTATNGSRVIASELVVKDGIVSINGGSRADVHTTTSLTGEVRNGSRLEYQQAGFEPNVIVSGGSRMDAR